MKTEPSDQSDCSAQRPAPDAHNPPPEKTVGDLLVETGLNEEDSTGKRWVRALLIFLAISMFALGILLQRGLIIDRFGADDAAGPVRPPTETPPTRIEAPPSDAYGWMPRRYDPAMGIEARIPPPPGCRRVRLPRADSFGNWLRHLPVKPGQQDVYLHTGTPKRDQMSHFAVIDLDIGEGNLQQSADVILRLWAEYLHATGHDAAIQIPLAGGQVVAWPLWEMGARPDPTAPTTWIRTAEPDSGRASFRAFLDAVFPAVTTETLAEMLESPADSTKPPAGSTESPAGTAKLAIGDVLVHPGAPGHAVIVLDLVEHPRTGEIFFLLGQGSTPAQDFHILRNPNSRQSTPWYRLEFSERVRTPEFTFSWEERMRFPSPNQP